MRVALRLTALTGLIGVLAVGCGGGGAAHLSQAAYAKALHSTVARMEHQVEAAYGPLIPRPGPSVSTTCSEHRGEVVCAGSGGSASLSQAQRVHAGAQVRAALNQAATELAALKPPTDVSSDNRELAAGLRAMGKVYAGSFSAATEKSVETRLKAIDRSPTVRAFRAAVADLERKGYRLGSLVAAARQPSSGTKMPPLAKPVKPRRFEMVSRAGRQAASDLTASVCVAKPQPGSIGGGCSIGLSSSSSNGPIPKGLSVVRPGETVRFVGPAVSGAASTPGAALWASKLCNAFSLVKTTSPFLTSDTWKVRLAPGAYVVSLSLSWQGAAGEVSESGNVGLLVSRTQPLRVLPKPRCQ